MAPGPRAVPRADPADRRRARRRDARPAAPVPRPVRRGPDPPPQARRRYRPGRGPAAGREAQADRAQRDAGSLLLEAQIDKAAGQPDAAIEAVPRLRRPARPHHGGPVAPGRHGRAARPARCGRVRSTAASPPEPPARPNKFRAGRVPRPPRPPQGRRRPLRGPLGRPGPPRERGRRVPRDRSATPTSPVDAVQIRPRHRLVRAGSGREAAVDVLPARPGQPLRAAGRLPQGRGARTAPPSRSTTATGSPPTTSPG